MEEIIETIVSMMMTAFGAIPEISVGAIAFWAWDWRKNRKVNSQLAGIRHDVADGDGSILLAIENKGIDLPDEIRLVVQNLEMRNTTLEGEVKGLQTKLSEKRSGRYGSIENTMEDMGETLVDFQNKLDTFQHIVDDNRVLMTAMNHQMEVQPHKDNEILEVLTEVLRSVENTNRLTKNMTIEDEKTDEMIDEIVEAVSEKTSGRCYIGRGQRSDDYWAERNKSRDTAIVRYDELTDRWLDEYDIQVCMSAIDGAAGMMLGVWSEEAGRYVSIYSPEWHKTVEWIASAEDLALSQKCHDEAIASGDNKFSGHDRNDPRIARYEWA